MSVTTETTRQDLIERFVVHDAVRVFVENLCGSHGTGQPGILRRVISLQGLLDIESDVALSAALFGGLWPEENPDENPEYVTASVRVDLLVSRIFGAVAENADACRILSDHFQHVADKQLEQVELEAHESGWIA